MCLPPSSPGLYQFSVVETAGPGTLVGRLQAQDPDLGDNALMAYSILDGEGSEAFSISTDAQGRDGLLAVRKVSLLPINKCRLCWGCSSVIGHLPQPARGHGFNPQHHLQTQVHLLLLPHPLGTLLTCLQEHTQDPYVGA